MALHNVKTASLLSTFGSNARTPECTLCVGRRHRPRGLHPQPTEVLHLQGEALKQLQSWRKGKIVSVHDKKAHGLVETQLHSSLVLALDGLEWPASCTGGFTRWGKSVRYPLNMHLEGARARGGGISCPLGNRNTTAWSPDRSLLTITSGVSWLPYRGCSCANDECEPLWISPKLTPTIRSAI